MSVLRTGVEVLTLAFRALQVLWVKARWFPRSGSCVSGRHLEAVGSGMRAKEVLGIVVNSGRLQLL